MSESTYLPIYEVENLITESAHSCARILVRAPTGSGKSTQIPQMLWRAGFLERGEVTVLQPRRLAARLLARRVAEETDSRLGGLVGYQIRLESLVSRDTRIRYVTEGILLRQMTFDPDLKGISVLVLDEFPWLEAPDPKALEQAEALLLDLGALTAEPDGRNRITEVGRKMLRFPVHPRLKQELQRRYPRHKWL